MNQPERLSEQDFAQVWRMMEESFPVDERRSREGQRQLFAEPHYHLYGMKKGGEPVAFAAVWRFETFTFLEHLAVERSLRNGGMGTALLQWIRGNCPAPLVLEVEPPGAELARRRIGFYERNGFALNAYDYRQPPLSAEGKEIPLLVMSYPGKLGTDEFTDIKRTLYRYVYLCDDAGNGNERGTFVMMPGQEENER